MLLIVDNGSVFITEISNAISKNRTEYTIIPSQTITKSDLSRFDSFVLSGRRRNDQKMNAINSEIINHALSENKPLLGICYGAEILALTLGGTIRKSSDIIEGVHSVNVIKQNLLLDKDIEVYQSHSRSEEHTSELQSLVNLVCRLLLEKKNTLHPQNTHITSHK